MSNALEWVPQICAANTVRAPWSNVRIAAIDPYDIAAVAAAILESGEHVSQHVTITGPEAILPSDRVLALARALGRARTFESQPDDAARKEMSVSMPKPVADAVFRFYSKGEFDESEILETVNEFTGRPPRDFMTWASNHADEFS